jgi:hypothetical protein
MTKGRRSSPIMADGSRALRVFRVCHPGIPELQELLPEYLERELGSLRASPYD